jgi:hypothetical protein
MKQLLKARSTIIDEAPLKRRRPLRERETNSMRAYA